MLSYSALIAVALFGALAGLYAPRRRGWLVAFPILLTQFWLRDAIFMTLPLAMLCATDRQRDEVAIWRVMKLQYASSGGTLAARTRVGEQIIPTDGNR